jgi:plastocyanin
MAGEVTNLQSPGGTRGRRRWMKRYLMIAALAAGLAVPAVAPASPAVTEISVEDNFFNPANPAVANFATGSDFHWTRGAFSSESHNIRQDQLLFRSGNPTTGPIDYTITASAGSYHYYCEVHGTSTSGMQGTIKVRPKKSNVTTTSFRVTWASLSTNTGDRFDVRYRVDGGSWVNWKTNTTSFSATFGNGDPVTLAPGHTYQVQTRTRKAGTTSKSKWSPAVTDTT